MTPETYNPVDVVAAFGKLVLAVVDTKVLAVTHIKAPCGHRMGTSWAQTQKWASESSLTH